MTSQLDYAPAPNRRRGKWRKWLRRAVVLAVLVAVLGLAGHRWGPRAWRRGQFLYLQHECMTYTAPPDFVIWEEHSAEGARLLASGQGYEHTGGYVWFVPEPINRYAATMRWSSGLAFLHGRRSPGGETRLVTVQTGMSPKMDGYREMLLSPRVIRPGTLTADPEQRRTFGALVAVLTERDMMRVYAGRPDPSDTSRFTIDYELNGRRGTIDGRLLDGDKVECTPRGGRSVLVIYGDTSGNRWHWAPEGSLWPAAPTDRPYDPALR